MLTRDVPLGVIRVPATLVEHSSEQEYLFTEAE